MLGAAFFLGEYLVFFHFRTDGVVEQLAGLERRQRIELALRDQERAFDLLGDTGKRVFLEFFHRAVHVGHAHHPRQLKMWRRQFRAARFLHLAALDPVSVVVEMRAPRDTRGKALLECCGARRVIAAHAERHHRDALGIDVGPARYIIVRGRGRHFIIVAARNILQAQRFTLPRAVDRQRVDAAVREFHAAEQHRQFLSAVEPVEKTYRRRLARDRRLHEPRRQCGAFVFHFDALNVWITHLDAAPEAAQAALVQPGFLRTGPDKTLPYEIIGGRTQIMRRRGEMMVFGGGVIAHPFDALGFSFPFDAPRFVVADLVLEALADAIDFADGTAAPARHLDRNHHALRPHEILGKILKPVTLSVLRHYSPFFTQT